MIISQNKHSRLYIYATIAHNFNKYKQNADKAIENVVLEVTPRSIFFMKITIACRGHK